MLKTFLAFDILERGVYMNTIKSFFKYSFYCVFSLGVLFSGFLMLTDKGYDMRYTFAEMLASSQHRDWAKYTFIYDEDLKEIFFKIDNPLYVNSKKIKQGRIIKPKKSNDLIVKMETIEKKYSTAHFYKGKILEISNPKNIQLVSSSSKNYGEQIFVLAKKVNAIAAINASGFKDTSGVGNGGTATGIVIQNGEVLFGENKNTFVGAFNNEGEFFSGKYSANELLNLGAVYAAGFKPQLISNGKKLVEGDGGWGIGPRTAIGQKEDGTVVMIVVDGRQPTRSMGTTIEEIQNILFKRGVVNAMSMDGGSSASMYFNNENVTIPSSVGHVPRYLPNIWAVVPKEGQKVKVYQDGELIIDNN